MSEERNFEQEARQEGWRPQEEWKGDPEKWVDAATFVERGEKISGILKKKVETLEQRLERAEKANQKFGEYHKKTIEKERKNAEQQIQSLEKQLEQAVSEGDGQAFTRINNEINNIKTNIPQNDDDGFTDLAQGWLSDNQWYNNNQKLAIFADGVADRLRAQGFSGKAYFDELTRIVKDSFPEEFENPNRKREANVDSGEPAGDPPAKKHSYKNLPADAKAACDEFVAQGFMTREEYIKAYDWEDE